MCTSKQRRFIDEYLIDLNGTQAAIRAGYSPRTANEQAGRFLSNPSIQEDIQKAQVERSKRTEITADAVLKEYAKIAFANMGDFAHWNGKTVTLEDSEQLDADKLAAVESIAETKNGINIKLHSKLGALDALSKHLGLAAPTDIKLSGSVEITNVFKELANLQAGNETNGDNT